MVLDDAARIASARELEADLAILGTGRHEDEVGVKFCCELQEALRNSRF